MLISDGGLSSRASRGEEKKEREREREREREGTRERERERERERGRGEKKNIRHLPFRRLGPIRPYAD